MTDPEFIVEPEFLNPPDPDYNESPEFLLAMVYFAQFMIDWNYAEHLFGTLQWHFTGGFEIGPILTSRMQNNSRMDTLRDLAAKREKSKERLALIDFAIEAFGRFKENRNALAHTMSIVFCSDWEKPRWQRASTNPKTLHVYCEADETDIVENAAKVKQFCWFLVQLTSVYLAKRSRAPLPKIFPLPPRLIPRNVPRPE